MGWNHLGVANPTESRLELQRHRAGLPQHLVLPSFKKTNKYAKGKEATGTLQAGKIRIDKSMVAGVRSTMRF